MWGAKKHKGLTQLPFPLLLRWQIRGWELHWPFCNHEKNLKIETPVKEVEQLDGAADCGIKNIFGSERYQGMLACWYEPSRREMGGEEPRG